MQVPLFKNCSRCQKTKFLTEFSRDKTHNDGHHTVCKQCQREYWRDRYYNDPQYRERFKEHVHDYYRRHPDKVKDRVRKWEEENAERASERRKRYWHEQVDKEQYNQRKSERRKERRQTDPKFLEQRRKDGRHSAKMRKYRMRGIAGSFTQAEWDELCARYDHRCLCCGEQKELTVDHIVPVSQGGTNSIDNLQPLCLQCNMKKNAKTKDYRPLWERDGE